MSVAYVDGQDMPQEQMAAAAIRYGIDDKSSAMQATRPKHVALYLMIIRLIEQISDL
jgi:hypothetical protein